MKTLLATALTLPLFAPAALAGEDWFADYDEAVEIARREGKHLLVDFTGSDWCGWCIKLDEEVFEHEAFLKGVRDDYVLVKLDFPRSEKAKAAVPNPERNEELKQRYRPRGFPTILALTTDGEVLATTGYQKGGPENYVQHLEKITRKARAELATVEELVAAHEARPGPETLEAILAHAEGEGKKRFGRRLAEALRGSLGSGEPAQRARVVAALTNLGQVDLHIVDAAAELDPNNARGLRGDALLALVESVEKEEDIPPAAQRIDAFFAVPDLTNVERDSAVLLLVYAAHWNRHFLDDPEKSLSYANLGLERTDPSHKARPALRKLAADE